MKKVTLDDLKASVDQLIRDGGYREPKEGMLTYHDRMHFNKVLERYLATEDEMDQEIVYDQLISAYGRVRFAGADPKQVPTSLIKFFQMNPSNRTFDSSNEMRSRERIKNPNKGIRSYCITCMGGAPGYVRDCPSLMCPLWPFRMGTNPFYGRLTNTDTEAEVDTSDELLEDETNGN